LGSNTEERSENIGISHLFYIANLKAFNFYDLIFTDSWFEEDVFFWKRFFVLCFPFLLSLLFLV
jgi:hypothetical protein